MKRQNLWMACAIFLALLIEIRCEGPPQYGYDNMPETSFTCEGKLQGRYYADPDTDCQLFHVCVKMSKRETQDFKFLCPNGTVFDQEHLVCADYYQVACNSNYQSSSFGHIFEFLKLSASKDRVLDFGKVPTRDPEYLGKNTLGTDDFQAEEYNNNKLAVSGNALQYTPNLKPKEIRFPTTTTRRTTPTPATTTSATIRTTTAPAATTTQNYYQGQQQGQGLVSQVPSDSDSYNAGLQSTTYQNNLNFHRETDVPQSFPTTTTGRPEYFQETTNNNYNNNNNFASNNNYNSNNFGTNKDYTTTTYAPQRYEETTTTRRPFFQYQTNPTTTYNFRETYAPSTFPTTTRRPFFQSTFRTSLDSVTTPSPIVPQSPSQSQSTFQQQPSRFNGDDFFQRIPTTEQSTTIRTQNLFFGGNAQSTYSPIDYYTTAQNSQYYIPQGRSINSQGVQSQSFVKTDRPKQFATRPATAATETYTASTSAPVINYYEPTKAPTTSAQPQASQTVAAEQKVDETPAETTEAPATTTTTLRPRRGGRRRLNPNRQRQQQQQQGGQPRNFDPQFKYSRRVQNTRESFAVKQKTEEIFNAEASVFRGQPKTNTFYIDDKRQPKEQDAPVDVPLPPPQRRPSFGGEAFGRRIRPGKQVIVQTEDVKPTTISEPEVNSRPDRTRVVKRLRQKTTTTTSTTTTTENSLPAETSSSFIPGQPFTPTTLRPARVSVRTKLAGGIPANADIITLKGENGSTRRRVIIKTYRPKSTSSSTEEPQLITAPIIQQEKADTPVTSTPAATLVTESNSDDSKSTASFTTFKVEEITYKPQAITRPTKNITATVGGFKVTTVITHSSDESSQPRPQQQQQQVKSVSVKPQFPKLNKKFLVKNDKSEKSSTTSTSGEDGQVGSTQSPDYDYSYYNTDDESQYVAEQNSQDRLFGKRARRPIAVLES